MKGIIEALKIRDSIEEIERIITQLMNQKRMHVSSRVEIFDGSIVVFVAEQNIGYGGYTPGYEIFVLKPESTQFTQLPGVSLSHISDANSEPGYNTSFQRVNITIPPSSTTAEEILSFAKCEVARMFGNQGDELSLSKWVTLQAIPVFSYRLQCVPGGIGS